MQELLALFIIIYKIINKEPKMNIHTVPGKIYKLVFQKGQYLDLRCLILIRATYVLLSL